jgi:hypothetical protein
MARYPAKPQLNTPGVRKHRDRYVKWLSLVKRINRKVNSTQWSPAKGRHWLEFITPPTPVMRWTDARLLENQAQVPTGPMASHINPHTGERGGHSL